MNNQWIQGTLHATAGSLGPKVVNSRGEITPMDMANPSFPRSDKPGPWTKHNKRGSSGGLISLAADHPKRSSSHGFSMTRSQSRPSGQIPLHQQQKSPRISQFSNEFSNCESESPSCNTINVARKNPRISQQTWVSKKRWLSPNLPTPTPTPILLVLYTIFTNSQ